MYKIKVLLIVSALLVISGCGLMPSFGKKKDNDPPKETTTESIETPDGDMFANENPENSNFKNSPNDTENIESKNGLETVALDDDWFIETASTDSSLVWEEPSLNISDDQLSTYSSVVSDQQDEITKLKSVV